MNNKTKKRVLTLALIIALLAIVMIGSSLAWFTAEDAETNVFTVGSVEIDQVEQQWKDSTHQEKEDFEDGKVLIPVVSDDPEADDRNYQSKIVSVKNTGKNPAYVQTFVAVPKELDDADILHLWYDNAAANGWSGPAAMDETVIDGLNYNVYRFRYDTVLDATKETGSCLEYVYVDKEADLQTEDTDADGTTDIAYLTKGTVTVTTHNVATDSIRVYVATQACQSEGFDSAVQALDAAFGADGIPDFS